MGNLLLFSSFCLSSPFCLPLQEEASARLSASAHSQGSGSISHPPWLDLGTWGLLGSVNATPAEPDWLAMWWVSSPLGSWMSCYMWAVRNWRPLGQHRSCPPGVYFVVSRVRAIGGETAPGGLHCRGCLGSIHQPCHRLSSICKNSEVAMLLCM